MKQLQNVDISQINSPDFFAKIEFLVIQAEAEGSPDQARELFILITQILDKIQDKEGAMFQKMMPLLLALRLVALATVSDQEKGSFMSQNITGVLKQDYADVKYWIKYTFILYSDDREATKGLAEMYLRSILQSTNLIGNADISIATGKVRPSVKNWIYDYNDSKAGRSGGKRGVAEQTTYVNQSGNTKSLAPEEREVLLKVLRIYDWLRFDVMPGAATRERNAFVDSNIPSKLPISRPVVATADTVPTKPIDRIAAKPEAVGFKSEFEQKLAAAGTVHGSSLSELKAKIEQTVEKNEGEGRRAEGSGQSVPKMTIGKPKPAVRMTPQEIRREVDMPELVEHKAQRAEGTGLAGKVTFAPPKARVVPPMAPEPPKQPIARPSMTLAEIKVVDDLKKIEVANLRDGDLAGRIKEIKSKIVSLAVSNNLLPFYTVLAFEQSPLFKAYMLHGSNKVEGSADAGGLTQEEFEALADLRKEVERL